jgi:cobalt-zinc-cadmium efflux system membrane fusion protein
MNAEVEVKSNQAYTVPEESVVLYGGKQHLFLDEGSHRYSMQEVETGTKENGFVEINNNQGLRGKKIVVKGAYTLLMALKNKQEEE